LKCYELIPFDHKRPNIPL